MGVILATEINTLKASVKAEMQRRNKTNRLDTTYASSTYDYTNIPATGVSAAKEHFNKIVTPLNQVVTTGLSALDANNTRMIQQQDLDNLSTILANCTQMDMQSSSSNCVSATCAGLCNTACSGGCRTDCQGCQGCSAACKTNCSSTCTGQCQGCSAACKTDCNDTCTGDCRYTCTGGCDGYCGGSSCQGGCTNGCTGTCSGTCGSSCAAGCGSSCQVGVR